MMANIPSFLSSSTVHLLFLQRERMSEKEERRIFPSLSISIPEISPRTMSLIASDLAMMNNRSLKLEFHGFIRGTKLVRATTPETLFFLPFKEWRGLGRIETRPLREERVKRVLHAHAFTIHPTLIQHSVPCIFIKGINHPLLIQAVRAASPGFTVRPSIPPSFDLLTEMERDSTSNFLAILGLGECKKYSLASIPRRQTRLRL